MNKFLPFLFLLSGTCVLAQSGGVEERFKAFDKNSDGVISGEEMNAAPILKRLDLDGNGSLTLPEALEALSGMKEKAEAAKEKLAAASKEGLFNKLDKNQDGKLTPDELPNKDWLSRLDADNSGDITLEEARAGIARLRRNGDIPASEAAVKPASEEKDFKESPLILKGSEHGIGHMLADVALQDIAGGKEQTLSARMQGSKGMVIAFFGATCPISQKFGPELARLEKDCTERGLRFLPVCPVASESAEDMQKFAATHGLKAPAIHDRDGRLTKTLAATTTTEVFLVDAARTLVYRGAINDQYGLGYAKEKPTKHFVRDAMTALLKQEAPHISATTAPGCALDHPNNVAEAKPAAVTYHNQISRILQTNCVECHRKGSVGPFSLETYEDVIENAGMMRKQVTRGAMPPWFAAPMEGLAHTPWINDRALSVQDKTDLLAWLNSDRPKGNPSDAPLPVKFPEEWTIGTPDTVLQLPKPFVIKAEGTMPYQMTTVATSFEEDRWVQAYEIIPTDRKVVHHVIVQVHPKGEKIKARGEGTEGYWAAYVPGNASHTYPEGFAKKLPAGATVSFQIHYTPNGKSTEDQLKLGLVFAKAPPRYIVHTAAVANAKINIPPGEANHVEVGERVLPADMNITAYMAHMHVRGKSFKFEAKLPGGKMETLLDLPHYDFNWQLRYDYAQPRFLPRGTLVKITAVYDNSEGNPANPDPTKTVKWGPQTFDEMMIGYFEYYTPAGGDVAME